MSRVGDAIDELLQANGFGADTVGLVEGLLVDVEEVVFEATSEVELIVGAPCLEVVTAWDEYQAGLLAAEEARYEDAIDHYEVAATREEEAYLACSL